MELNRGLDRWEIVRMELNWGSDRWEECQDGTKRGLG